MTTKIEIEQTILSYLAPELVKIKEWMEDCMLNRQERGLPGRERYEAVCAALLKVKDYQQKMLVKITGL